MPAYNAAGTIRDSIQSVLSQQDPCDWELVVVDDGSTDDTLSIARELAACDPRVTVMSQANAGAGSAVTAGVLQATGEFVVRLDADDVLLPHYCLAQSAFIDEHPGFDIYACNAYRLFPDGRRTPYHSGRRWEAVHSLSLHDLIEACEIFVSAAVRKDWFIQLGGMRAGLYNEDYDFWIRAMAAGARHIYNPQALVLYRVHPGQKTSDGIKMREGDIVVLSKAVAEGVLDPELHEHAEHVIRRLRRNVALRRFLRNVLGERNSEVLISGIRRLTSWYVSRPRKR